MSGMQPEVGQVVTVFRSRLRSGAEDGERVTVVTFAARASHDAFVRA